MTYEEIAHRFKYHPPKDEQTKQNHEFIRGTLKASVDLILTLIPEGREASVFVTKMEEAMFWANAALARRK